MPSSARAKAWRPAAGLLSAPLLALAFPGAGWSWLACVAVLPLLAAMRALGPLRRFLLGWLSGALAYFFTLYSVAHLMQAMSGLSPAAAWASHAGVSAFVGLEWALFAFVGEWLRVRAPQLAPLTLPTLFVGLELFFPKLFPLYLGSALSPAEPLNQLFDLVGVHGASFLLVVAQVWMAEGAARAFGPQPRTAARVALAVVALFAVWLGYGWVRLSHVQAKLSATPAPGQSLRYAVVQPFYTPAERRSAEAATMTALGERTLAQLRALPPGELDLVFLGESAFPYPYVSQPEPGSEALPTVRFAALFAAEAKRLGAHLVFGSPRYEKPDAPAQNSLIHVAPDGRVAAVYDKLHLVPFGERMPLGALRGLFPRFEDLKPGTSRAPLVVGAARLAPSICYEAIFPDEMREAGQGAHVLLNATNDGWFGDHTNASALHLVWQRGRALELRIPLLRAALTGISAEVGPDGRVVRATPTGRPAVMRGTLALSSIGSPFGAVGSYWLLAPALLAALLFAWAQRKRPASSERAAPTRKRKA